jgi:truncated hemoglobin YjbI
MILSHGTIVHYSPVNIDETDDSLQMELDPSLTGQRPKTGRRNRKVLTRKLLQEIGEITTDKVLEIFKFDQTLRRDAVWCRMRRQDKDRD